MDEAFRVFRTLHRADLDVLHLILYAGSCALGEHLTDPSYGAEMVPCVQMSEFARMNRIRKTGWVVVSQQRLWLTRKGLEAAPVWLSYALAQSAKRAVAKHLTPLKHRIPWLKIADLWIRADPIRKPLERWFDPALTVRD